MGVSNLVLDSHKAARAQSFQITKRDSLRLGAFASPGPGEIIINKLKSRK